MLQRMSFVFYAVGRLFHPTEQKPSVFELSLFAQKVCTFKLSFTA